MFRRQDTIFRGYKYKRVQAPTHQPLYYNAECIILKTIKYKMVSIKSQSVAVQRSGPDPTVYLLPTPKAPRS